MVHEQRCIRDDGTMTVHREKPSRRLEPCRILAYHAGEPAHGLPAWNDWENDLYYGSLRRYESGAPLGGGGPYAVIGISTKSEAALHDWRDFQRIKNDLLGTEWEGVELYPAESRLVDPSNRFYIWCFPPGVLAALGFAHRRVEGPQEGGVPQRPFPEEE